MNSFRGRHILVTGGTGVIGRELVKALVLAGSRVRVSCFHKPFDPTPEVDYIEGDLMDRALCARLVQGIQDVFHLASVRGSVRLGRMFAADFFVKPILMNTNMMEEARKAGVERYLFTSSVCVYSPAEYFVEDRAWDLPPHPSDAFAGWAKRMGELQASAYHEQYGWDRVAIVRPVNIYGPYDDFNPRTAQVIPALIARIEADESPLRVWGDGTAIRDFLFSRDAAAGLLLAMEKSIGCSPVNLGSGIGYSIREIVDAILESSGKRIDIFWDNTQPSGEKCRVADMTRASERLGFTAGTSLKEGIRETLLWYRKNHSKPFRPPHHFVPAKR